MSTSNSHQVPLPNRASLTKYAWLSIGAALATIVLKTAAYYLTGSIGLLSDAIESLVNLAGALMALWMLTIAARPPDDTHSFGHSKAEYFASGVEGTLILAAAAAIAYAAIQRLLDPQPLEQVGIGLVVSIIASTINFVVSRILMRAGKANNSITLEADAQHLMTDVWTSVGVVAAVALVSVTGWLRLDPIIALIVAANIVWTGYHLIQRSIQGLMDKVLPEHEQEAIEHVMADYRKKGIEFHALRTRQSANRRFIAVHVLVPGDWTVHDAHHLAEDFEQDVMKVLGDTNIVTHLEPIEDEISMNDISIDR